MALETYSTNIPMITKVLAHIWEYDKFQNIQNVPRLLKVATHLFDIILVNLNLSSSIIHTHFYF